jgi:hypothetical protein
MFAMCGASTKKERISFVAGRLLGLAMVSGGSAIGAIGMVYIPSL